MKYLVAGTVVILLAALGGFLINQQVERAEDRRASQVASIQPRTEPPKAQADASRRSAVNLSDDEKSVPSRAVEDPPPVRLRTGKEVALLPEALSQVFTKGWVESWFKYDCGSKSRFGRDCLFGPASAIAFGPSSDDDEWTNQALEAITRAADAAAQSRAGSIFESDATDLGVSLSLRRRFQILRSSCPTCPDFTTTFPVTEFIGRGARVARMRPFRFA
jgi:hypothetical protein